MKKAIIAGASGMVGGLVLQECIDSNEISEVVSLVRKQKGKDHQKVKSVPVQDFTDYSSQIQLFKNVDIAFFCIGVYARQVSSEEFKKITIDYAVAFAQALKTASPNARLCFLSGQGADRTEKSRMDFARFKGKAENEISDLKLGGFHSLRPSYIYPVQPRKEPGIMYKAFKLLYPIMQLTGAGSIKSTELAKAMVNIGLNGASKEVLENKDILEYV